MNNYPKANPLFHPRHRRSWLIGLVLIIVGFVVLLDLYLRTGWVALLIMPTIGLAFLTGGIMTRRVGLLIVGGILSGLGFGSFIALSVLFQLSLTARIGFPLLVFGLGWITITLLTGFITGRIAWWPLIPGGLLASLAACFFFSSLRFVDFTSYGMLGLGIMFLVWGLGAHLFGLIIPGALLATIGPGIYLAWANPTSVNGLSQTGVMLVWFALGWGLITVLSRVVIEKFIWWPLIPGGILAMTGWGLYIGGSPQYALTFIGNTGSIGLILFGLYLMLWRSGLKK
jgi:hypothetical protein